MVLQDDIVNRKVIALGQACSDVEGRNSSDGLVYTIAARTQRMESQLLDLDCHCLLLLSASMGTSLSQRSWLA